MVSQSQSLPQASNSSKLPHNNRMQSDSGELALASAADAGRYVHFWILTIVSIMILLLNEWRSQDLEGYEIQSQGDSIL